MLKLKIEIKRKDMYKKAKDLGFTHPQVVNCSQELDVLLNNYFDQAAWLKGGILINLKFCSLGYYKASQMKY